MTLLERKRQLVKDELSHVAAQLIARNGYEETTVEQIVEAAGVSRRTFFRYFRSKEDVIVEMITVVGERAIAELATRPAGEPPGVSVRHALDGMVGDYCAFPAKSLALTRMILDTPALRARYLDRQFEWRREAAAALARRGDGPADLRYGMIAGIAFTALDVALVSWAGSEGREDLAELLDQACDLAGLGSL
ncbi:TetR family transcriptional regulator [Nonomuraea sp. LPB2021202275-12-8]|uniref:TetR family transcriptional regulator n=1 Tax=Nonomuraea sp. LPB2021202275-12-8 TaxID=3120159 RepID=UPI00300C37D7